jgi:peptidoglycan hydrolase-like protein with peptidoglycan-binding domain
VQVRPKLHVNGLSTAPVLTNTAITGTVAPGKPGRVLLQREISGRWRTVSSTTPRHRKFTFTISPATYQSLRYRVVYAATRAHTQATSKTLHITVVHRSLTYGDTGKDVLALQQRLRALHYDVGPASKSYGWDMVHAVTAFQKAQGDNRNGVADLQVWKQINHPKRPHLKYPVSSGYAVEVNIEKQLLLISKNGKVWRILDTSTAGGYYYTNSEGQSEQAITPRGHFSIQYKLTGWVKSKLGELYYPSYFTNTGYAIHGEGDGNDYGEVPPVPASHGCVRITNNAVLRYYYKVFTDGTSVWVY